MGTGEIWPFWETLELSVSPYAGTQTSASPRPHRGPHRADNGQTDGQTDGRATEICSSAGAGLCQPQNHFLRSQPRGSFLRFPRGTAAHGPSPKRGDVPVVPTQGCGPAGEGATGDVLVGSGGLSGSILVGLHHG